MRTSFSGLFLQELRGRDAQPLRNARDVIDRDISLRAFNAAQVCAINPTFMGQGLLTEPARGPKPAHVSRQNIPQWSLVSPFHRAISARCRF
jgi:hypothetical protein